MASFPRLQHLFLGEITYEEQEISWIDWHEPSRLLNGLHGLRTLYMRGGSDRSRLAPLDLPHLEKLVIQSGGLHGHVLDAVLASRFPELRNLELWLGVDAYGAIGDPSPLLPLLNGDVFPTIRNLGLRNSDISDEIAAALDGAPVLEHVDTLDLGGGQLYDTSARHLAQARLGNVSRIVLHHHFVSEEMLEELRRAHPGIEIDADTPLEPETGYKKPYLFTQVSE